MVEKRRRLLVDQAVKRQMEEAWRYIHQDSVQQAEQWRAQVLASFKSLLVHPEKYPPDKYRLNNDGNYRAYELLSYRVSYHVSDKQITVLRLRHTKMNPLKY